MFEFSGALQIYLDADYSDFPSNQLQDFRVNVRFEGPQGWEFDIVAEASVASPKHQRLGVPMDFTGPATARYMKVGEAVSMRLVAARWSFSPRRGLEDWQPVKAEVVQLALLPQLRCALS